jgi:glyoxylase-like metal-dependent hydrolase (beta-lactamase superfamily II)
MLYDFELAAPGTWIGLARPANPLNCNIAVFEQDRGLLVVDSGASEAAGQALLQEIRARVSRLPVRRAVITHGHYDHAYGLQAFRGLVPVITSEAAQRTLREIEKPLPDVSFSGRMVLHGRGRDLHLLTFGRAHTAADVCVWCPETRVLVTGDLVTGFVPGMGDGFPLEWPRTLEQLAALPFETIIPGHGPLQKGRLRFEQFRGHLDATVHRVREVKRRGGTLADAQAAAAALVTATEFGAFASANAGRFRLLPAGQTGRDSAANGVQANVKVIWDALSG